MRNSVQLRTGHPWWLLKNGILGDYPPLLREARCDLAIVGGGITGALLADRLARSGQAVVVIDQRSIGEGSTAASTALLQYEVDTPLWLLARRIGAESAARIYSLGLESIRSIEKTAGSLKCDCGFSRRPSIKLASRSAHLPGLAREHTIRRAHGFATRLLSGPEVRRKYGFDRDGALLTRDAAQIDPYAFTHGLLGRAIENGARVHDRTTVLRYSVNRGGVKLHTDRGATVVARRVIFATGYETLDFMRPRLTQLRTTYAMVTDPLGARSPARKLPLMWETARPYLYFRSTPDGRLIIGGGDTPRRGPEETRRTLQRKTAWLDRALRKVLPGIEFEVAFSWSGVFGETRDTLPLIGANPAFPRALFALGYGGNGITFSVIAADVIEGLINDGDHPDAALFSFDRSGTSVV